MTTLPTWPPEARCDGCRHWTPTPETPTGQCGMPIDEGHRASLDSACFQGGTEDVRVEDTFERVRLFVAEHTGPVYVGMVTRADFGCVLWEPRS
jgi:hypothetical protein